MSEPGAALWISQADSDWACVVKLFDPKDHRTFCQTIAKSQQTVEKSVKAIFASIKDRGINLGPMGYDHNLTTKFNALKRLPSPRNNREIQALVNNLLDDYRISEINFLCGFAPKAPAPGNIHARNTEYPYEVSPGTWTSPALMSSFSEQEVIRARQIAEYTFNGARQIVSTIPRLPP